tara:strand:+ start:483 stop:776 length:294 start_codon:yes stop_codon:yes gene_type:complete
MAVEFCCVVFRHVTLCWVPVGQLRSVLLYFVVLCSGSYDSMCRVELGSVQLGSVEFWQLSCGEFGFGMFRFALAVMLGSVLLRYVKFSFALAVEVML